MFDRKGDTDLYLLADSFTEASMHLMVVGPRMSFAGMEKASIY